MRVATWHGGKRFTIDEAPDPVPGPDQVVIEVDTVGICGTDVHITQGLFPATPPQILGHEFCGRIAEVGAGVDRSRIGQSVACDISNHCLECVECRVGRWSRCVNGERASGAYAEYVVTHESSAIEIPPGIALETVALTEPASCCLSGMEMVGMVDDAVALVIGGGVMGLFSLAFAKYVGAKTAILSDPIAARREMAVQLGADIVHDPAERDLKELVDDVTDGLGVHVATEAVGKPELVARAIELTRPRGTVLMIGVNPAGSTLPYDLYDLHYREIVLRGAFGRGDAFGRTLQLLPGLNLEGIISARYPLEQIDEAFAAATQARGVKTAIKPGARD